MWSEWSSCSQTCGSGGTRTRVRYSFDSQLQETGACPEDSCPDPSISALGSRLLILCIHLFTFSINCLFTNILEEWGEWSSCQLSLSGTSGFQVRNRECSGRQCSEDRQEMKDCTHSQSTPGMLLFFQKNLGLFGKTTTTYPRKLHLGKLCFSKPHKKTSNEKRSFFQNI